MTYFPRDRRVIATAWSRDLHIDHQPIEDVRLIDVLSGNWTLRLVANGRLVQFGGFRNFQETYLWSSLSRKIFRSTDVDIARIIGHLHPAALKDDWDDKPQRHHHPRTPGQPFRTRDPRRTRTPSPGQIQAQGDSSSSTTLQSHIAHPLPDLARRRWQDQCRPRGSFAALHHW